ncbi:MAG TPA: hypothetical protein VKG84_10865 [Candidatus Acidoferrales bacterium]|nr:hypothetical protein [Candidatus Acidoferrales bacterium]
MKIPTANSPPAPPKPPASIWRKAWRVFYWASIVAGAWMLVLMLRRAPSPQVTVSPQAAQSAEQKMLALATPPSLVSEPNESRRIELSEEELNSFLAAHVPGGGGEENAEPTVDQLQASVQSVKVTLQGDQASIFAVMNLLGKDLTLQLQGRLHVVGGYLRFEPTGGNLGDLALPQSALSAAVTRLFDKPENREKFRVPAEIRDVRVENGALVIERQ